jgi:hypothetical protein
VEKRFFGPGERRLGIMGLLRLSLYTKYYRATQKGVEGNMKGDGTLLGGQVIPHSFTNLLIYFFKSSNE